MFVTDAVFAPEALAKHGIPFMVDLDAWLKTLDEVARLDRRYGTFVPGHGVGVPKIGPWAAETQARLREIRELVGQVVHETADLGEVVKRCTDRLGMVIPNLTLYLLAQTAVMACLASLQSTGQARLTVEENRVRLM